MAIDFSKINLEVIDINTRVASVWSLVDLLFFSPLFHCACCKITESMI